MAVGHLPRVLLQAQSEFGWSPQDVDLIVPHQVSRRQLEVFCEVMRFPVERCQVTADRLGNVGAANIPIALSFARQEGRLPPGTKVVLIGLAPGSWSGSSRWRRDGQAILSGPS